ncbi:IS630 transposase-related protein [Piscirickettsia salmonis]|uniref:IS630 transposase-related protein n=1 Tax=Piscirickettsia salmonis TaxID=1238 RepID=UPI0012BB1879|nr:IS630 transposase-related protein [Piscirickettsia salmonis]QGP61216.1 Transposase [Piscirickettsia salmonis]
MGYPVEFRRKVFKLKEKKGLTYEEVSELFGVSMRTLFRWNTRIEIKKKAPKPRVINLEELKRKRRYLGRYFAHPMMQNRRAKRDDYKSSAVRVTQRYVP